jgi:hypothetical protein
MIANVPDFNMSEAPHFVVTVTGPIGTDWLSEPNDRGVRSLVSRERAAVFPDIKEAGAAITQMHQTLASVGVVFSVETVSRTCCED